MVSSRLATSRHVLRVSETSRLHKALALDILLDWTLGFVRAARQVLALQMCDV